MKKIVSLLLAFVLAFALVPVMVIAEEASYDMAMVAESEKATVEAGDQFLVNIKKTASEKKFLTFRINGSFDADVAEIIAPVYSNESLGILTNRFDNESGLFTFEGYDQTIRGTDEDIICSLLFKAKKSGEFNVILSEDCMLGKAGENAFYALELKNCSMEIADDTDGEEVLIITDAEPLTPYDDMFGFDWAEKAVGVMYELGVLEDIADKSYYPDENITRGDFITMLMRVCKQKKAVANTEPFKDVDNDGYQFADIMTAKVLGVAKGDGEGNFMPGEYITRQDVCTLVFRTMLKMNKARSEIVPDDYLGDFSDKEDIAYYAVEPVAGLLRAKIIKGDDNKLIRPEDYMTRAEAAVLLNALAEYNILISM